jgi:hypothetical protein
MNNFYSAKKEWLRKPEKYNVSLLSFEPGPNPNIISATRPRPGPWVGRVEARARADLKNNQLHVFLVRVLQTAFRSQKLIKRRRKCHRNGERQ